MAKKTDMSINKNREAFFLACGLKLENHAGILKGLDKNNPSFEDFKNKTIEFAKGLGIEVKVNQLDFEECVLKYKLTAKKENFTKAKTYAQACYYEAQEQGATEEELNKIVTNRNKAWKLWDKQK